MKRFYVYLWKDPKDGTPRYVGKGQDSRVWYHLEYEKKNFALFIYYESDLEKDISVYRK